MQVQNLQDTFVYMARTIDCYGGPTLSDVAQMSDIRLRSMMYGRICRGLGARAGSESLIANTIPPISKHLQWSTGKSQCLTTSGKLRQGAQQQLVSDFLHIVHAC